MRAVIAFVAMLSAANTLYQKVLNHQQFPSCSMNITALPIPVCDYSTCKFIQNMASYFIIHQKSAHSSSYFAFNYLEK